MDGSFGPPYVLEVAPKVAEAVTTKPSKKRRRDAEPVPQIQPEAVRVFTYKPDSTGPYAIDAPKLNQVRFTPTQVDAIVSGTQPGLTVIVGPPGTGKTDVATQIINNIYHNYPDQRTLLIAHSNQALNQLFQKIVALDIDERHLLRLGHGEEELDTEANFSKHGRVESFLDNRDGYLREVDRLAANFGAPGAHGSSAETAGYFNSVYVESAWTRFQELSSLPETTVETIVESFPFHHYFSNAPQPLFPAGADKETVLDVAKGCYHHVSKIFTELADVRPFEILRRDRDKANYLLTNEARIIAMTSTHAAMRRREIASLGFHYDNVIMEEAAQITEIENFIPLALQNPQHGQMPLQRVVLCGDHFQNSPVIQNLAFRQYANLEQSLFSRLVRLGVPTINLDQQGRARPSIASLYSWRYKNLGNLPIVSTSPEFQTANAGFKYDYQFIEVPDYKGRGESEPTPHFIQNLGEAEYAVAIYQYMRLLGYPASSISILATYAGQRALIKDVLSHRCAKNPLFGLPKVVTTVDKYQGEQNDCTYNHF
jgi:intron-binding protein aquarius